VITPFDPTTALLARHAQHVVLIHFPIALFISGAGCDFFAEWKQQDILKQVARYNLLLAAFSTLPALVTGVLAWQWALEGKRLRGVLLLHLVFACVSSLLIWLVAWLHWKNPDRRNPRFTKLRIATELLGIAVVAVTGHLGGFLSGVNAPG
jgi:uncharacterized membrane protein